MSETLPLQDPNQPQLLCSVPSVTAEDLGSQPEAARYDNIPDLPVLFEAKSSGRHKFWRGVMFVAGIVLTVWGAFGTFVPVTPGIPFVLIGLPMMAASNEYMRRWVNHMEAHLPLRLRKLLRYYKPTMPPQGATPAQLHYWRKKMALSALKFIGCVTLFCAIGYASGWLLYLYS